MNEEERNRLPESEDALAADVAVRESSAYRRLDLNVLARLKEVQASVSICRPWVMFARSPLEDGPLESVQVNIGTERVAFFVPVASADFSAGGPAVAALQELVVRLCSLSPRRGDGQR